MASSVKTATDLKTRILARIKSTPDSVWTPADFVDIASRAAVDKTLQRLVGLIAVFTTGRDGTRSPDERLCRTTEQSSRLYRVATTLASSSTA
jgi:hypothetical protein